jgi:hypothetical protein
VHAISLPGAAYYPRAMWLTSDSLGDKTEQMQRKGMRGFRYDLYALLVAAFKKLAETEYIETRFVSTAWQDIDTRSV